MENAHLIKDLYPKHNKKFLQFNIRKINNPAFKKWTKDLNRLFTKNDIWNKSQLMKNLYEKRI